MKRVLSSIMKLLLFVTVSILNCGSVFAQYEIMNAWVIPTYEILYDVQGSVLRYSKTPYYDGAKLMDPITIGLAINVSNPVKVKYSLYTYKWTFSQDNKRNYIQGIQECWCDNPLKTQEDINKSLDKIYEFPVIDETSSITRELQWDGYTDPKFTGEKYPVRDCLYVLAQNADTDEILYIQPTNTSIQTYSIYANPGVNYTANGKKVSAKIILAYDKSVKITAILTDRSCGIGALTYNVVNQGAEAIIKDINKRLPEDIVAYTELIDPTVDSDNKAIKIFEWKDIKDQNGKDFYPEPGQSYQMMFILEAIPAEMTFTLINNGFIYSGGDNRIDILENITSNEIIFATNPEIKITSYKNQLKIECPDGVCLSKYVIFNMNGQIVKQGKLSNQQTETITIAELQDGFYFVKADATESGNTISVNQKITKFK